MDRTQWLQQLLQTVLSDYNGRLHWIADNVFNGKIKP